MIIEGGKRGGRKGEKDTSGDRGERRGRYPSEVAFSLSLSLSLSLSRREGGGEDRGERTEQTVLFLSFALCPHASLSSLCMCVYRHSPANPSASSSFPCFPIEAVRKTRFFVPPLAENALALIAEREKGEWRKGKEGANGKEFPPRGLITGSQGKKEEERERGKAFLNCRFATFPLWPLTKGGGGGGGGGGGSKHLFSLFLSPVLHRRRRHPR